MSAPTDAMAGAKASLRAQVLRHRDAMSAEQRGQDGERLDGRLQALPEWAQAQTLLLYLGIKTEYNPLHLAQAVLRSGRVLALPRIDRASRLLEMRAVRSLDEDLVAGVWGLREPDPQRCALVPAADLDLVLVPGVAFDLAGGRMGYGAGFYDRLLEDPLLQAPRVAALFRCQLVAAVPRESHDLPVHTLVLPDGAFRVPT